MGQKKNARKGKNSRSKEKKKVLLKKYEGEAGPVVDMTEKRIIGGNYYLAKRRVNGRISRKDIKRRKLFLLIGGSH